MGYEGITYADQGLSADIPLYIAKAGKDLVGTNLVLDDFVETAREANVPVEHVAYEEGVHGFDVHQDTAESREIIKQTLEFMRGYLFRE